MITKEEALKINEHDFSKNTNWHTYYKETQELLKRIYLENEQALLNLYKEELEYFDSIETEPAPSGEWEEYNIHYLVYEARVEALAEALELMGIELEEDNAV